MTRESEEVTRSLLPVGKLLLPAIPEGSMEFVVELGRDLVRLARLVERDGLPDVVDHDLAGVAAGQVRLEALADGGVDLAVDIVVQGLQELIALHGRVSLLRDAGPRGARLVRPRLRGPASAVPGAGAGRAGAGP